MITRSLCAASAHLLTDIIAIHGPADTTMDRFFRRFPKLGQKDRGVIAETVYGALRHYRLLTVIAGDSREPLATIGAFFATLHGYNTRQLTDLGIPEPEAIIAMARKDRTSWPLAITASLPDWLANRLNAKLSPAEAQALGTALLQAAPLDIRVNTLKTDRDALQAALASTNHEMSFTPLSPWGLRRPLRAPLFRTPEFAAGHFEVQDEGSQLIAPLVGPRRGERVVDYCAGAGGKTLHLAALMNNGGTLYACDTSQKRLDRLKERIARAGCDNVRVLTVTGATDTKLKRLHGKIDRVLVDAPCSGTGTLRRSPDAKWRTTEERVALLAQEALAILLDAARLVRPGGRLVYATCSLLQEENEDVIQEFLAQAPAFQAVNTPDILARRDITVPHAGPGPGLRLWPHIHGTDGFFAQVLERSPDPVERIVSPSIP